MDTAAVDLEIVDKIEVKDDEFFHLEDIMISINWMRNIIVFC